MSLSYVACLVFLSIAFVQSLVLQNGPASLNQDTSSNPLSVVSLLNITKDLNTSSVNEGTIRCDGSTYGSNLKINSCFQAFSDMSKSWHEATYRNRTDQIPSDVRLPQIIVSSKSP